MNKFDEDNGWKVNIIADIEKPQEDDMESITRLGWSRKKKIKVLLVLIMLVFCVSACLLLHILGEKPEEDRFIKLVEAGAYSYAYTEYIKTDEDAKKYDEYVKEHFDYLVDKYNATNDLTVEELVYRYQEVFGYRFSFDTGLFEQLYESKMSYRYALGSYEANDFATAYDGFSYVIKKDSNYESARKYMSDMRKSFKNEIVTVNIWYSTFQEKLIAEKLEQMYLENDTKAPLYKTKFEYKLVTEEEIEKGLPQGECGIIFRDIDIYENESRVYGSTTDILMYNNAYFENLQVDSLNSILDRNLEIPNIYIPLSDGEFLSGLISTYSGAIYREEIYEEESWKLNDNYTISIGNYDLKNIMNYVRKLNNNPKVYTADDGVEKFINGEVAAAIISSEEYYEIKNKLGDKLSVEILPSVNIEGIDLLSVSTRLQGVNRNRTIELVYHDNMSTDILYAISDYIYEEEFARFLFDEFGIYNDFLPSEFDMNDSYVRIVNRQYIENYNNIYYYDTKIGSCMDKLTAFSRKAASEDEINSYVDNIIWEELLN